MNMRMAVLLGLAIVASPAACGNTLAVSGTIPYYGRNVSLSFDWNIKADDIYDVKMSDGFALMTGVGGAVLFGAGNSIQYMVRFTDGDDRLLQPRRKEKAPFLV